jgi:hypothetical protein
MIFPTVCRDKTMVMHTSNRGRIVMASILKAIAALLCGCVLSLGVPNATLAINNLAKELEQQEADERVDRLSGTVKQEEATPEGIHTVQGEVLRIKRDNYLIRKYTGDVVHLHLDENTVITGPVRQGNRIEAKVSDQGQVLQIHTVL